MIFVLYKDNPRYALIKRAEKCTEFFKAALFVQLKGQLVCRHLSLPTQRFHNNNNHHHHLCINKNQMKKIPL